MYDITGEMIKARRLNPFRSKKLLFFFRDRLFFDRSFIQEITLRIRSAFELSNIVMIPDTICSAHPKMASISVLSEFLLIALPSFGLLEAMAKSTSK